MTKIYRCKDLEKMVLKMGFLPFFANDITDFSIEEFTPQELWFSDEEKGPLSEISIVLMGNSFRRKQGLSAWNGFRNL